LETASDPGARSTFDIEIHSKSRRLRLARHLQVPTFKI